MKIPKSDKIQISYGSHTCKFTANLDPAIEASIRELMLYKPKDAGYGRVVWIKGKRQFVTEETKCLFNRRSREFPTGFLPKVLLLVPEAQVINKPTGMPYLEAEKLNGITPRFYQEIAFRALVRAGRGVAVLPTGTGKTLSAAMLAAAYQDQPILITVPNINLLDQNRSELTKFMGEEIGILGDGDRNLAPRVVVSTIQSLASRISKGDKEVLKFLTTVTIWISDESHGAAADSYRALSKALVNAYNRFGLTATWIRTDGCEAVMEGVLGDVLYEYSYEAAFKDGYLTPIRVWDRSYAHPTMRNPNQARPDYATVYKNRVVNNIGRNLQIALDAAALKDSGLTPCLVLVNQLDQGEHLSELLNAPFINGESKTVKEVLTDFMQGTYPIVIASRILNIGVNLPNLRSALNAGSGDSEIDALQKPGRGLRLFENKEFFDYIDYYDNEPHYLKRHGSNRYAVYKTYFPKRVVKIHQGWSLENISQGYEKPVVKEW